MGTVQSPASSIDLALTIAELAEAMAPDFVNGRLLVPLLQSQIMAGCLQAVLAAAFGRDELSVVVQ